MKAIIVHFRRGRTTQHESQMIIKAEDVDTTEKARSLIGRKVTWKSVRGKEIKGTVLATHGRLGQVRAKFERGMPGQSLGKFVEISNQ